MAVMPFDARVLPRDFFAARERGASDTRARLLGPSARLLARTGKSHDAPRLLYISAAMGQRMDRTHRVDSHHACGLMLLPPIDECRRHGRRAIEKGSHALVGDFSKAIGRQTRHADASIDAFRDE